MCGSAAADRQDVIRAGRERTKAVRKAKWARWRLDRREEKARVKAAAAALKERAQWARAVLRREREEGGVAYEVKDPHAHRMSWPVPQPPSPGEAERFAEESAQEVVRLAEVRRCRNTEARP